MSRTNTFLNGSYRGTYTEVGGVEQGWTSAISVHNDKLDGQHKKMIDMASVLISAVHDGKAHEVVDDLMAFLRGYCQEHFADEEAYMLAKGYPHAQEHRCVHLQFLTDIEKLKLTYDTQGMTDDVLKDLKRRVSGWIINHIAGADQDYARFVAAKHLT
ncbi:MAG: hemerythrin family protein [Nitrosarchaeum sp.]|nr:hemerythrin family protein [Nitrosarchaeum sp.]